MGSLSFTEQDLLNDEASSGMSLPRVLIIEDDPDYALLLVEALEEDNRYVPEVAASAGEARKRRFDQFSAILLDYRLPDVTGFELLDEIVSSCETPTIVLTGENVVETAVEAIKAGAFNYLVKNTESLVVLPEIVGQAVAESARRREHKELLDRMHRAEKLAGLGTLAAGLCHEMNNPLAVITGAIELYEKGIDKNADRCLKRLGRASCRVQDVVRAVAAFAADSDLPAEQTDIAALLRQAIERQSNQLSEAGVAVDIELPERPLEVRGSAPGLMLVFSQLVSNAREALVNSEEKVLSIRAARAGDSVCIEVEDTGPGVPKDIRKRIFDPFFTTRDPGQGMGMGLAIANSIIERHGGRIECRTGSSGGAVFFVELPVAARNIGQRLQPIAVKGDLDV